MFNIQNKQFFVQDVKIFIINSIIIIFFNLNFQLFSFQDKLKHKSYQMQ